MEALNISVLRFIADWNAEQRLLRLLLVTKPMSGEELARDLNF